MSVQTAKHLVELQAQQILLNLHPNTSLTIELVSPLIHKSVFTIRSDITRRPHLLPKFTRTASGGILFQLKDVLSYIKGESSNSDISSSQPIQTIKRKRGRPSHASREGGAK